GDGKDHKPCRVIGFLLKDIAAGNMTRDSDTISFGPSQQSRGDGKEADEPNVQEPEVTENEEDVEHCDNQISIQEGDMDLCSDEGNHSQLMEVVKNPKHKEPSSVQTRSSKTKMTQA
ncbi:hypothetical protein BG011_003906, partial [Mortierella polycephala]